jgi:radical SAM superfamily enzyme YgiQ (UPF0313 family)
MSRPLILLVNPWIHDFAAYDLWARPMGLLVLATRLRRLGWEPILVDCLDRDHPDQEPTRLKEHGRGRIRRTPIPKPEVLVDVPRTYARYGVDPQVIEKDLIYLPVPAAILVTGMMTYWYPGVQEIVRLLKAIFEDTPIFLGGVYASLIPDHARQYSGADRVLVGPGEAVLPEVLSRLTGIVHPEKSMDPDLEFRPALDLMSAVRFLPLLTSRGCPFSCSYCASRKLTLTFVRRSPDEVVEEIEAARHRYGISDIALYDDAFLVDARAHALPLLRAVAEKMPGLKWHTPNGLHAAAIDAELAEAMYKAGFETIRIGLERASDSFHSATGRKTTKASFLSAVTNLRRAGFSPEQIGAYLLVGLPGQTRTEIEDDVDEVLRAGAYPKLAEYSPIPGTEMWHEAVRASRFPIEREPLFQNCTLLPAAEPEVDWTFLQKTRARIREHKSPVKE